MAWLTRRPNRTQVHRQRFVAEFERVYIGKEVAARHQHVAGGRHLGAWAGLQQGAVVTHPEHGLAHRAFEITRYQVKFTHGAHRGRVCWWLRARAALAQAWPCARMRCMVGHLVRAQAGKTAQVVAQSLAQGSVNGAALHAADVVRA